MPDPITHEEAVAMASELMDQGAPRAIVVTTLQRQTGFSRASCYRFCNEAIDARGDVGVMARPNGSDLIVMSQQILASQLCQAHLESDRKAVAQLSKVLFSALQANGSITSVAAPEPCPVVDTVTAIKAAHSPGSR
jgi:hypothetical protein